MTEIPDDMLAAADHAMWSMTTDPHEWPSKDDIRRGLAAALDAAPTLDGPYWCQRWEIVAHAGPAERDLCAMSTDCPGPHHALLVGPALGDDRWADAPAAGDDT